MTVTNTDHPSLVGMAQTQVGHLHSWASASWDLLNVGEVAASGKGYACGWSYARHRAAHTLPALCYAVPGPTTLLGLLVSPVTPKQSPSPASSSSSIHLHLHQALCPGLHYASPPQLPLCSLDSTLYSCPQLMSSRLLSPFSPMNLYPPFFCCAQGPD